MEILGRRVRRPVRLGSLRRTVPISTNWGYDRGSPVDRYYIEAFLEEHRKDVRGASLEVANDAYIRRFDTGVTSTDVLHVDGSNPHATIVADLTDARNVDSDQFDCFILTQTLQFVYDVERAVGEVYRLLRPQGVVLATLPALSRLDPSGGTDFGRFTAASCERLFGAVFGAGNVTVTAKGNVLAAIAFLAGLAAEELSQRELDVEDELFPLLVTVRAVKRP